MTGGPSTEHPPTFLEGIRVLDLSRILAGPLATQVLADLGAEVLKIEPPTGDPTRGWGPPFVESSAAYYHSANRNKASLVLDLRQASSRQRLAELVARADVVVENFGPGVASRLGVDPARALERHPDLVWLRITGYSGTRRDEPGYDLVLQAEAGIMAITGPAEGPACKVGVAVVDVLTGLMAANGVLAALVRRGRTGTGARLSVSLHRTALFSLVNVAWNAIASGEPTRRWGNEHPNLAPYEAFEAIDAPLVVGVGSDDQFRRLCTVLGLGSPEHADLRALDNAGRLGRRREVHDALASRIRLRRSHELVGELRAARVPAAPILRPDEALATVASWDPAALVAVGHDGSTPHRALASPLEGDGLRRGHAAAPALGQGGEEMAARWRAGTPGPGTDRP